MGSDFWWIFDALVIMIAVYLIYSNAKRGLSKVFVLNIGYVIAIFLSGLVAVGASPLLYETIAEPNDVEKIQSVNVTMNFPKVFADVVNSEGIDFTCDPGIVAGYLAAPYTEDFEVELYHYINKRYGSQVTDMTTFQNDLREAYIAAYSAALNEKLPSYVQHNFETAVREEPGLMTELLTVYYRPINSNRDVATDFEHRFGKEPNLELMRIWAFLGSFAVIMIIVALIAAMLKNRIFFNVFRSSEVIYGALLGLAETVGILILFTATVRLIVLLGGGEVLCFNDATIEQTKVFKLLYEHMSFLI